MGSIVRALVAAASLSSSGCNFGAPTQPPEDMAKRLPDASAPGDMAGMAPADLALAPSVLLVVLLRRFVVQGLAVGGVKG